MVRRYLVIYLGSAVRNEDSGLLKQPTKAVLIDDDDADGAITMPFGIDNEKVAEDCMKILAIVLCANPPSVPFLVIDDVEYDLDPDSPEVEEQPIN